MSANSFAQDFVFNTAENKVPPYILPNPLQTQKGKLVTSIKQWNNLQRPYIYHLFEENVYGTFPLTKIYPKYVIQEINEYALNNTAIRKQVRIYLHPIDTLQYIDVLIYLPRLTKQPMPIFLGYNFFGNHTIQPDTSIILSTAWVPTKAKGSINNKATALARGTDTTQWQLQQILSHGFGLATAYYGQIEPDHSDGWKTGIRQALSGVLNIKPQDWSAMGAWAWGLCRVMDYIESDNQIDKNKVAIIGHSRLGKAALWAAASDKRFSVIISNESGEGGAALSKRWYGETIAIINQKFPHWFASTYKKYNDNAQQLPLDQHMLLSLIAPRPLYVASAEGDQWSDPKGEFLSAVHAGTVYALFNKKGVGTDSMPPLHQSVGNTIRYHIRAGKHDVVLYDWQQYLQFAAEQWK